MVSELPEEMLSFNLLQSAASQVAPRLGQLCKAGRKPLSTPHYVPISSRGTLPHVSHDTMRDHASVKGLYVGLEDCTLIPYPGCSCLDLHS